MVPSASATTDPTAAASAVATDPTAALDRRRSRRYHAGSAIGLVWLTTPSIYIWSSRLSIPMMILGQLFIIGFGLLFVLAPRYWQRTLTTKLLYLGALFASTFLLYPFLGWNLASLWIYVAIAAAMSAISFWIVLPVAFALAVGVYLLDGGGSTGFWVALSTVSVSLGMFGFSKQVELVRQLRIAQGETARVAVEEERNRVARDIHDLLGHSLTVITVKAELAGRLMEADPARAAAEVADIERLGRSALADVRSTVTGYRGVALTAELSGARAALDSAGIEAELPRSVEEVGEEHRELFGWVVREGVTNVIRHSGAKRCSIILEADAITISDDGRGSGQAASGNGLRGLSERARAAGSTLTVGRSPSGGFLLRVSS